MYPARYGINMMHVECRHYGIRRYGLLRQYLPDGPQRRTQTVAQLRVE
jgi:hypothetical protein